MSFIKLAAIFAAAIILLLTQGTPFKTTSINLASDRIAFSVFHPGEGRLRIKSFNQDFKGETSLNHETTNENLKIMKGKLTSQKHRGTMSGVARGRTQVVLNYVSKKRNRDKFNQRTTILNGKSKLSLRNHSKTIEPCALDHNTAHAALDENLLPNRYKLAQSLPLVLEADYSWYKRFGSLSNAIMLNLALEAEKIYRQDLEISFSIKRLNSFTKEVLTSNQPELESYQELVKTQPLGPIYHMFLGKNLKNGAVGIAYLATACKSPAFSAGVTRFSNFALTPLTFAHELGHTLGAAHAPFSPESLMSPALSINNPFLNFSDQSKLQIRMFVKNYGTCLDEYQNLENPTRSFKAQLSETNQILLNWTVLPTDVNCQLSLSTFENSRKHVVYRSNVSGLRGGTGGKFNTQFKGKIKLQGSLVCNKKTVFNQLISLKGFSKNKKLKKSWFKDLRNSIKSANLQSRI